MEIISFLGQHSKSQDYDYNVLNMSDREKDFSKKGKSKANNSSSVNL